MGNRNTKSSLRNAIIFLNISADPVRLNDDKFWAQIWSEDASSAAEVIKCISNQEIRMLRDGSPKNFASLTYKMVERLHLATGTLCNTQCQQTAVLNATRMLTRIVPIIFEDPSWRNFFTDNFIQTNNDEPSADPNLVFTTKSNHQRNYRSYLPPGVCSPDSDNIIEHNENSDVNNNDKEVNLLTDTSSICDLDLELNLESKKGKDLFKDEEQEEDRPTKKNLMNCLILSVCDLLFCPEFTVTPHTDNYLYSAVDAPPEDLKSLATCDFVWEPGVGFDSYANSTTNYDKSRIQLMRLLLACLSTTLYESPESSVKNSNLWIELFASNTNRHALPIFTSFLNVVFIYKPAKLLPFNSILFEDNRQELIELALQILIVTLDYQFKDEPIDSRRRRRRSRKNSNDKKNLFIEYMSRIHRSEDFIFLVEGFKRLLNNCLEQGYLINTSNHINFDQELLILFWRICNLNSKFVNHLLKTRDVLDITVPILYHLNENFQDPTKSALIHIGVFNLLILSGERSFGVKLNKPYVDNVLLNLPTFTGSHADLMIIVFHKLILYGQNLHQLFDFLLTILVNISPYLKALTMIASKCLIQLFEIFSTSYVVFTEPNYHQLVVFLLEVFNNLIQYQFDGNINLVYSIIIRKEAFQNLANLPSTSTGIKKVFDKLLKKKQRIELIDKQFNGRDKSHQNNETIKRDAAHDQSGDYSNRTGATVSSNNMPSSSNVTKQEVSLVATPDLSHVTQAIHPFDTDSNNSQFFFGAHQQSEGPSINFDDILNQAVNASSAASCDSTGSTNRISSPRSESFLESCSLEDEPTPVSDTTINLAEELEPSGNEKDLSKWKPSPEWVRRWKQTLPLHTTLRMIEVLSPQVERFKREQTDHLDEAELMKFLQSSTLVGLLPVPHPILIRKYHTNTETTLWFRVCTWGIIYVRTTIWTNSDIRLMKIV